MAELIRQLIQILLDEMGIDEKRQFMLLVIAGLAGLVVYFVRDRHRHGIVFTMLFTGLCFSALVFLFTESEAARHWSALIGSIAIAAILGGEFVRRRRAAASAENEANAGNADPSAAAGQS